MKLPPLEETIEVALTVGLLISGLLFLGGLALGSGAALHYGILLLMFTPVARVVLMTLGLAFEGDWLFASVSLFVLSVLSAGIILSAKL